jgi:purine-cytosine permease-like protein
MFAVEALAAIAGIIGLTLPFAFYTTLTSFMALLANPIIFIPGILGLGAFMTRRANKKIRNALLPTIITQLAVSSLNPGETQKKSEQIVDFLRKINVEQNK